MRLAASNGVLKEGGKRRNLKIRNACLKALQAKAEVSITYTGRILLKRTLKA
jgi:hypothetical protein